MWMEPSLNLVQLYNLTMPVYSVNHDYASVFLILISFLQSKEYLVEFVDLAVLG